MALQSLEIPLGDRSYEIISGDKVLNRIGEMCLRLRLGTKVMLITNPTVGSLYGEAVASSLAGSGFEVYKTDIPDGEAFKTLDTLKEIYDSMICAGLDRHSSIVALGGGVVGDVGGFAAATFMRGISCVQVPTTLLSQVDSSVGGKTGVNHEKGKNLIGSFHQPRLVLIDVGTLDTLPDREYLSGLGEIVKYGVVNDAGFFDFLECNVEKLLQREKECLLQVVGKACQIKAEIVAKDERESGLRAVLNYGHTLGHAIESLTGYTQFLHGEAVSIGIAQAAKISEDLGHSKSSDTGRIIGLLKSLRLPTELPPFSPEQYADSILHDKKAKGKLITFVLNCGIGGFSFFRTADAAEVLKKSLFGE